ncbi:hypothetical protein QC761_709630 [Podospora bellae-mahoneyi]|uniref:60S ribosomal protein L41 n=2 Tax=Podospora TaxID=5144 RepID=A0ABR0F994_9PEZI|nr:hypothetical protein QC761_709630 [Podospora bellae-mahoneyi]KAK4668693.1 hypothetical protein QC764_709630 [Podospora pseudoanserina]
MRAKWRKKRVRRLKRKRRKMRARSELSTLVVPFDYHGDANRSLTLPVVKWANRSRQPPRVFSNHVLPGTTLYNNGIHCAEV